jgi:hypothetical protein
MSRSSNRRTFLGGAAAWLGLPLALRPTALAQPGCAAAPKRLIVYYLPNGMIMSAFTPQGAGPSWTPSRILKPLEPLKNDVSIVTGLANRPGIPERGAYHAAATGAFATANHVAPRTTNLQANVSIDQKIAKVVGACTKLGSLQLGFDDGNTSGDCDHGYSCAYWNNISWSDPRTLLPKITNPATAFSRVFAGFDAGASSVEQQRRMALRKSLLDHVREEARALEAELGAESRQKLEQYLVGVRDLERRIVPATDDRRRACTQLTPPEVGSALQARIDAHHRLITLAFQCDATRVVSFMLGNSVSGRNFSFLGADGNYHGVSHHGGRAGDIEKLVKIETWELTQFAALLALLKQTPDVDGKSLLDNTCVYLSSEFSDPNRHDYRNLPTIVAGKCGGVFSPGKHLVVPNPTPMANLFVTIQQAFGLADGRFGDDGTAPLPGLA